MQWKLRIFLNKFDEHLSGCIDVYSFCLLPNHFHFLIQVKELNNVVLPSNIVSQKFSNFFNAYSKAINKQEGRVGSLFQKPFKRKEVSDIRYLTNLVYYIHTNPQSHGIIDDFRMYPWSSYNGILLNKPSNLKKENVVEWFGNKENYLHHHNKEVDLDSIVDFY